MAEQMINADTVIDKGTIESGRDASWLYLEVNQERAARANSKITSDYPAAYPIIPPRLYEELAKRNPEVEDYKKSLEETLAQINRPASFHHGKLGQNGEREVYDVKLKYTLPGEKARFEGDPASNDKAVNDAYDYTGIVREFYRKEFGLNSLDNKGMKLVSSVNYGEDYSGAFWNGKQMTYGHAGPLSAYTNMVRLDIAGHEITHGISENEHTLRYYGQSGALNESFSDVFGSLIKQYEKKQTADQADWLLGDGIWKPEFNGRALRDLLHPGTAFDDPKRYGKDPQPDHMRGYIVEKEDNGGVHDNSGIPNRAFAEFSIAVGGHAWEIPGHIWFNARRDAGREPSFYQFAYYTIEEAKKLNRPDVVEKLERAWKIVGVTPSKTAGDDMTPTR